MQRKPASEAGCHSQLFLTLDGVLAYHLKHILPIAAGHFRPWKGGNG